MKISFKFLVYTLKWRHIWKAPRSKADIFPLAACRHSHSRHYLANGPTKSPRNSPRSAFIHAEYFMPNSTGYDEWHTLHNSSINIFEPRHWRGLFKSVSNPELNIRHIYTIISRSKSFSSVLIIFNPCFLFFYIIFFVFIIFKIELHV